MRHEQAGWRERLFVRALPLNGEIPELPVRQREVWQIIEEHRELPLQELLADLQADCPLQELTPVQCTLASSAEAALKGATLNSRAAVAAMAAPDTVLVVALDISIPGGG